METKVVCVKVKNIRPQFKNLEEWMENPNNIYIARKGIVFIDNERFPKEDSIWANPFKIDVNTSRNEAIDKYKTYITKKLNDGEISHQELLNLKGKQLGCWCKDKENNQCHGDILVELINNRML